MGLPEPKELPEGPQDILKLNEALEKLEAVSNHILDEAFGTNFEENQKRKNAYNLARLLKLNELGYVHNIQSRNNGEIIIRVAKPIRNLRAN